MASELINPFELAQKLGFSNPYHCYCVPISRRAFITYRKAIGVTQAQLGSRVGFRQPSISLFETGGSPLSLGQAADFARAIGCDWTDLIEEPTLVATYLLVLGEIDHPSAEARVWWARARVAEYRGDVMRCNWFLDLAVLFEKIERGARA